MKIQMGFKAYNDDPKLSCHDTRFDPKQLVEVYKQYMPLLTFADELNIFEHPKYKDMLAENHTLAKAAAEAMVDRSEYEALRADYDASRMS